jgi:hypothetical protein
VAHLHCHSQADAGAAQGDGGVAMSPIDAAAAAWAASGGDAEGATWNWQAIRERVHKISNGDVVVTQVPTEPVKSFVYINEINGESRVVIHLGDTEYVIKPDIARCFHHDLAAALKAL